MQFNPTVVKRADISVPVPVFVLRKFRYSAWEVTGFMSNILVNSRPVPSLIDLLEFLLHFHGGTGRLPEFPRPSAALGRVAPRLEARRPPPPPEPISSLGTMTPVDRPHCPQGPQQSPHDTSQRTNHDLLSECKQSFTWCRVTALSFDFR